MRRGDPRGNVPGQAIVIPDTLEQVPGQAQDIDRLRSSYVRNAARAHPPKLWDDNDVAFVAADLKMDAGWVRENRRKRGRATDDR